MSTHNITSLSCDIVRHNQSMFLWCQLYWWGQLLARNNKRLLLTLPLSVSCYKLCTWYHDVRIPICLYPTPVRKSSNKSKTYFSYYVHANYTNYLRVIRRGDFWTLSPPQWAHPWCCYLLAAPNAHFLEDVQFSAQDIVRSGLGDGGLAVTG